MTDDPYHMRCPDLTEARSAIAQLYGEVTAARRWSKLLADADLSGKEQDPASVRRLAETMMAADPVMALSGRSLMIRVNAYEYLRTASEIVAEAG